MKNNSLLILAFLAVIGFFGYITADQNKHNDYLSDAIILQPNSEKAPKSQQATETLDDVFNHSTDMTASEMIDEAELLLATNDDKKVTDALFVLNNLADQNPRASFILAELYEKGIKVEQNDDIAISFYEKAAMQGHENANIYLFNHYLDNDDLSAMHFQKARTWFEIATKDQKNPIADYALAHIYEQGLSVDKNLDQAMKYYQQAAQENFVLAYEKLANLYLLSPDNPKQIEAALLLFQRAANEDIATAQYKLGYMYEMGFGTKQDYETARFWYGKAANNHLANAQFALGHLYEAGLGVDKDNVQAYEYYRKAAEFGESNAQIAVARAFERGIGVDKDLERAIFWYAKAAEQKNGAAEYSLGRIFEEYESIRDLEEAKAWYQRAADAEVSEAVSALNRLNQKGNN